MEKIDKLINRNFVLLSINQWDGLKQFPECEIALIKNSSNKLHGAIAKKGSDIMSVGTVTLEELENQREYDWNAFEIWVVIDKSNKVIGWCKREAIYAYYCRVYTTKLKFYEQAIASLPGKLKIINANSDIIFQSGSDERGKKGCFDETDPGVLLSKLLNDNEKKTLVRTTDDRRGIVIQANIVENGEVLGAIQLDWESAELEKITMNLQSYANLVLDLKAVFDTSYDVIYVSDGDGITLRVSSACETLWGYKAEELIGKSVHELEKNGVYKPSITRLVLERKEKVQAIQTTKTGRRLRVVGTPIKDETGKVVRVINTSRDITQESILQTELVDMKALVEGYKKELAQLREQAMENDQIVYKSEQMRNVITLVNKVSEVDSTVLILGESGVGKEVIASYIHLNSVRKDKPFIKLNCGAIPEQLLESELFGYEKGAFTGASKIGKPGLFELANEGSLFLDEIGELPMALQVKLLRILQDNELIRVGGTNPIKINVRIIAATNRDLELEMKQGRFREDLFYRLNVIPVYIPPLRKRKDDILPLALHFLNIVNRKHNRKKALSNQTLEYLQSYCWPGNVRELQNIVERLVVIADSDPIEPHNLPLAMLESPEADSGVKISSIMPWKLAFEQLERQLLTMAMEKYHTTTKMAEVLGLDQTTISRKLKRLNS